ncbi:N-glycosylase/DNA lyase [Aeropyrum camini]|uniref:N-glycosylase/DNA lyase n=1 Tax=Aeropyrum camini TaxID=229980 RepID=UPI000788D6CA|nr:N-glycosylase/DNA lyase [Aeropyrum camini]
MAQRLRWERVEGVARAFSRLSLGEVLAFEEQADPQYKLVSRLASEVGPGKAAVAALLTGLASYRLAMRGEEWWLCFYRHMRSSLPRAEGLEGVLRAVEGFLTSCSGAAIGREAKLRRVRKAASAAETPGCSGGSSSPGGDGPPDTGGSEDGVGREGLQEDHGILG